MTLGPCFVEELETGALVFLLVQFKYAFPNKSSNILYSAHTYRNYLNVWNAYS